MIHSILSDVGDVALPRYRSSAAARMVNIPVATLRVWERRYQVVAPQQAPSGHRLYSGQDVRRLVLIKQLVDQGNSIGTLARLDTARLQDMLDEVAGVAHTLAAPASAPPSVASDVTRVVLVGRNWGAWHRQALEALPGVEIVGQLEDGPEADLAARALRADMVLAEYGALHMDTAQRLWRLARVVGATAQIVAYGFAATQVLDALRARGAVVHQGAPDPQAWSHWLADQLRLQRSFAPGRVTAPPLSAPPRFDAQALEALTQAMPRVACECPRHLSQLIVMLGQFETYSADCESRQPADVALHAYLYRVAGQARSLMEEALVTLAQAEGVPLPK